MNSVYQVIVFIAILSNLPPIMAATLSRSMPAGISIIDDIIECYVAGVE